jgi:uncharacterized protein YkwD
MSRRVILCSDDWYISSVTAMTTVILIIAALSIAGPAYAAEEGTGQGSGERRDSTLSELVITYTNEQRARSGLEPLKPAPALGKLAHKHSLHMCRTGEFAHESKKFPKGYRTFSGRMGKVGLKAGGENIGYRTLMKDRRKWAEKMVSEWMKSQEHRRNILEKKFQYIGVGTATCGSREVYATQVFAPEPGRKR